MFASAVGPSSSVARPTRQESARAPPSSFPGFILADGAALSAVLECLRVSSSSRAREIIGIYSRWRIRTGGRRIFRGSSSRKINRAGELTYRRFIFTGNRRNVPERRAQVGKFRDSRGAPRGSAGRPAAGWPSENSLGKKFRGVDRPQRGTSLKRRSKPIAARQFAYLSSA